MVDMFTGAVGGMCISGIIWAVRQEGRLNAHDQKFISQEKMSDERHEETKDRLVRIEAKLDHSLNGKH